MLTQHTTAAALLARFRAVRSATREFCGPLTPEDELNSFAFRCKVS